MLVSAFRNASLPQAGVKLLCSGLTQLVPGSVPSCAKGRTQIDQGKSFASPGRSAFPPDTSLSPPGFRFPLGASSHYGHLAYPAY